MVFERIWILLVSILLHGLLSPANIIREVELEIEYVNINRTPLEGFLNLLLYPVAEYDMCSRLQNRIFSRAQRGPLGDLVPGNESHNVVVRYSKARSIPLEEGAESIKHRDSNRAV
ncbi:hypothetical protein F4824DRAFT_468101 [Ustulina deusta]|nr:hypothetical protein F4824DRAFT_468101 [Ustulina deusta]